MQLTFSVRHGETSDRLRDYAESEVAGLGKVFDRLVEGDIILDQEGHRHIAEVRLHTSNDTHFAASEAADWRTAIDATVAKLRRQLKRHKGKLNQRPLSRDEREGRFAIVGEPASVRTSAPPQWDRLSTQEAITRLEQSGEDVLVFVDVGDGEIRIARRAENGSVNVVEADAFEVEER